MLTRIKKRKLRKAIKSKINSFPVWVHLWVTDKCNEVCSYCHAKNNNTDDPSFADIKHRIDHVNELGAAGIALMGGEPTLRDDLSDLILHADSQDLITFLTTNGKLLTRERIFEYAASGLDVLELSLDGYGALECSNKTVDKLGDIIDYLREARRIYRMGLKFHQVLTPETIVETEKLFKFAKSVKIPISYGIAKETFTRDNYSNNNYPHNTLNYLKERAGLFSIITNPKTYFDSGSFYFHNWEVCDVGRHTLAVASNGKVYLCSANPILTKTDFLDVNLDYFKKKRHLGHIELADCRRECKSACAYTTSHMRKHPLFCYLKSRKMSNCFDPKL